METQNSIRSDEKDERLMSDRWAGGSPHVGLVLLSVSSFVGLMKSPLSVAVSHHVVCHADMCRLSSFIRNPDLICTVP